MAVDAPYVAMISLLQVKGYSILRNSLNSAQAIDRDVVLIPDVLIEDATKPAEVLLSYLMPERPGHDEFRGCIMAKKSRKHRIQQAEVVLAFAAKLRELRQVHGLSQQELAHKSQVSLPYIGRLERSGGAPGIDIVERLAKALGVTLAELLPSETAETDDVLKQQIQKRFQSVMSRTDRSALLILAPWLAMMDDSLARSRR